MNKSVATLRSPEFINITQVNPLISKCEIKVFYVGQNRNGSAISQEVAERIAQTLPGCPIVGYYIENKSDFSDHGDQMIIDGEGIRFNTLTKPYGFVPTDAKVWFKEFDDVDKFGKVTRRNYLVTEGYLWTGQFEECKKVISKGNPQSMELDANSLKGNWSTDSNSGMDFFIINDATISKLCILGDDVEPCFEGASVTAPKQSYTYTKLDGKDDFSYQLFTMLKQLREFKNNKGGYSMDGIMDNTIESAAVENQDTVEPVEAVEETIVTTTFEEGGESSEQGGAESEESSEETQGAEENTDTTEEDNTTEIEDSEEVEAIKDACENVPKKPEFKCDEQVTYAKTESEEKKDEEEENKSEEKEDEPEDKKDKEEEEKKNFELLQSNYDALQNRYNLLETEVIELRKFKATVEDKEKDELIASFYMLSDEDKKDVIENKANYSLREIKAELSMICVDKKVNFNLDGAEEKREEATSVVFNLNGHEADTLPAWLRAVKSHKEM